MYGVAFSPDGVYLACVGSLSSFCIIYKRNGDTFTKLLDIPATGFYADLYPYNYFAEFSPDGQHLAISGSTHQTNNQYGLKIYKRSGDTFTLIYNPQIYVQGTCVSYSPDGAYLTDGTNSMYRRDGDVYTQIYYDNAYSRVVNARFSPDGVYMASANNINQSSGIYLKRYLGGGISDFVAPNTQPAGSPLVIAISPDSTYIAAAFSSAIPYLWVGKIITNNQIGKTIPYDPNITTTLNVNVGLGYAQSDVANGQTLTADIVFCMPVS